MRKKLSSGLSLLVLGALEDLPKRFDPSLKKLKSFYTTMGFKSVRGTQYMVRDTGTVGSDENDDDDEDDEDEG